MEGFFQAAAAALLALVLILTLQGQNPPGAMLLSAAVCVMLLLVGISYLSPIMDLIRTLEELGNLQNGMVESLLKITGISVITEIAAMVCTDGGNSSLGKALKLTGTATILWLAIPVFEALMDLVQRILEGV